MHFLEVLKECNIGINGLKQAPIWEVDEQDKQALKNIKWPGRNQVLNVKPNLTYFLDGAHTIDSIQLCSKWFSDLSNINSIT